MVNATVRDCAQRPVAEIAPKSATMKDGGSLKERTLNEPPCDQRAIKYITQLRTIAEPTNRMKQYAP
jgi:hypothetical protein